MSGNFQVIFRVGTLVMLIIWNLMVLLVYLLALLCLT